MRHRSRLLIAWIAGSLCWIGYWCWHDVSTCSLQRMGDGRAITCHWSSVQDGASVVMSRTEPALPALWHMVAQAVVLPLGTLIAGLIVGWVIGTLGRRAR